MFIIDILISILSRNPNTFVHTLFIAKVRPEAVDRLNQF